MTDDLEARALNFLIRSNLAYDLPMRQVLAAFGREERRRVWAEVIRQLEFCMESNSAYSIVMREFLAWCRQQAESEEAL